MRSALASAVDDAVQDVLLECFRPNGVLQRADPEYAGGFRAFLFGVVRNVARRYEAKRRIHELPHEIMADDTTVGQVFDREFARAVMREASQLQLRLAQAEGPHALRRFQLLSLRFQDSKPIRDIAVEWNVDAAWLHHQYATARTEFRRALMQVVALQHPQATPAESERIARGLLGLLE
jgi:RNA polymerase sigma-70 factor (ECF subfamily)